MEIQYLSHSDAASFGEIVHSESELAELFAKTMLLLEADTDYDTVMISFEDDNILRIVIEDSPYTIVLDEQNQSVSIIQKSVETDVDEFNEDGIETLVDIIASRILTREYDAD